MSLQYVQDQLHEHNRRYGQMPTRLNLKVLIWVDTLRDFFSTHARCSSSYAVPSLVPIIIMGVEIYPVSQHDVQLTQEQALQEYIDVSTPVGSASPLNSLQTLVTVDIGPYRYAVDPPRRSLSQQARAADEYITHMPRYTPPVDTIEPPCLCRSASEHEVWCGWLAWKKRRK